MAYNKRTWLGRQGTGLNKFSIGGATPVTIVNQPDSVTQVGDALSAGNMNDLEDRIEDAFDDVDTALDTKADEQDVTNLNNAINQLDHRLDNLEQAKGDYIVSSYKDGSTTPSGKGKWCVVEGVEGVSRVENNGFADVVESPSAYGITRTKVSTGKLRYQGEATSSTSFTCAQISNADYVSGHLYLVGLGNVVLPSGCRISTSSTDKETASVGPFTSKSLGVYITSGVTVDFTVEPICTDLNVYFGTSDLSFLGATDSAKLATIQTNYPHLLLPSDYGTRIVDWTGNGVRAFSANILPPMTQTTPNGTYSDGTYTNNTRVGDSAWTGKIDVSDIGQVTIAYDSCNGEFRYGLSNNDVSGSGNIVAECPTNIGSASVTVNTSGFKYLYLYFRTFTAGTTATLAKARVNVGDTARAYSAWFAPSTLSFPSTSLKSAGSVREKKLLNVEVEIDGQKVQKSVKTNPLGVVDLGSLNWEYIPSSVWANAGFRCDSNFPSDGKDGNMQVLCAKYLYVGSFNSWSKITDQGNMVIGVIKTARGIVIRNDSYTSASDFKTAMSGVMLYYELETPDPDTYFDPILDNTLLTESGGRLSTVQTGTVVDGSFDMGFINL